jgi:hypothetical protein
MSVVAMATTQTTLRGTAATSTGVGRSRADGQQAQVIFSYPCGVPLLSQTRDLGNVSQSWSDCVLELSLFKF